MEWARAGRGDGCFILRELKGGEVGGEAIKERLGNGISPARVAEPPGKGTGGAAVKDISHDGNSGKGGMGAYLMRAQVAGAGFPEAPVFSQGETGKTGGAFFALGGRGDHLGLGVMRQEGGIYGAGFGAAVFPGEEVNAGYDTPVAVLLAEACDCGTVQPEESDAAVFGIEVVDRTETGGLEPEEFGFFVLQLGVESGIEIGVFQVPRVFAHRNGGRLGKGDPIGSETEDRKAQGIGAQERRGEAEGGRRGIFGSRTQGLSRATKKPRFGKRIRGQ